MKPINLPLVDCYVESMFFTVQVSHIISDINCLIICLLAYHIYGSLSNSGIHVFISFPSNLGCLGFVATNSCDHQPIVQKEIEPIFTFSTNFYGQAQENSACLIQGSSGVGCCYFCWPLILQLACLWL